MWTTARIYVEHSEFSLALTEPSLGARICPKHFTCITSSNVHSTLLGMGFEARQCGPSVCALSPLPYLAPQIWYL